jgi:isoamyl acetate esterase
VPEYKQNLIKIIKSPQVTAHSPRIILITPPPIDERTQRAMDVVRGYELRRSAANTKAYADAAREVAYELEIPCCDLWTRFMEIAGWEPGAELPGSENLPPSEKLRELLSDGELISSKLYSIQCLHIFHFDSLMTLLGGLLSLARQTFHQTESLADDYSNRTASYPGRISSLV